MYIILIYVEHTGRFEPARDTNNRVYQSESYAGMVELRETVTANGYVTDYMYVTPRRKRGRR